MNVIILYYDGFCEFELVFTAGLFKEYFTSVGVKDKVYVSEEGQIFLPEYTLENIEPVQVDLLFIPGGRPDYLFANKDLYKFLRAVNERNGYIAAICGGTKLLANAGLLAGKRCTGDSLGLSKTTQNIELFSEAKIVQEDVVQDGNIITATGRAYLQLAIKLGELFDFPEQDDHAGGYYRWLKMLTD